MQEHAAVVAVLDVIMFESFPPLPHFFNSSTCGKCDRVVSLTPIRLLHFLTGGDMEYFNILKSATRHLECFVVEFFRQT